MFKIIFALPTSHWDGVSIIQECIKAPTKFPMTTLEQTFTLRLINNTSTQYITLPTLGLHCSTMRTNVKSPPYCVCAQWQ